MKVNVNISLHVCLSVIETYNGVHILQLCVLGNFYSAKAIPRAVPMSFWCQVVGLKCLFSDSLICFYNPVKLYYYDADVLSNNAPIQRWIWLTWIPGTPQKLQKWSCLSFLAAFVYPPSPMTFLIEILSNCSCHMLC